MRTCLMVGAGGFMGTILRYFISLIPLTEKTGFPLNTLLINVLGSLVIGILSGMASRHLILNADWMAFFRIGLCGGFTTFSTFALETANLFGSGKAWSGILYIALSVILGLAAVFAGERIPA